jgi:hypothetical protein
LLSKLGAGQAAADEIGTQIRHISNGRQDQKQKLVFPEGQRDHVDRKNVRSTIKGLNILFSAGFYRDEEAPSFSGQASFRASG